MLYFISFQVIFQHLYLDYCVIIMSVYIYFMSLFYLFFGAWTGTWTLDPQIKSLMLYQRSYPDLCPYFNKLFCVRKFSSARENCPRLGNGRRRPWVLASGCWGLCDPAGVCPLADVLLTWLCFISLGLEWSWRKLGPMQINLSDGDCKWCLLCARDSTQRSILLSHRMLSSFASVSRFFFFDFNISGYPSMCVHQILLRPGFNRN